MNFATALVSVGSWWNLHFQYSLSLAGDAVEPDLLVSELLTVSLRVTHL